ncbi:MAG: prenyltransferase/squalene oxidase repeat-containing protein [Solirubrobacteraceae bacterium]
MQVAALTVAVGLALAVAGAQARDAAATSRPTATPSACAAARAVAYLLAAQNSDGGFGAAPGQPSNELYSGWAALGLAAAGRELTTVSRGPGLLAYVRDGSNPDPGSVERTILVLRAAGEPALAGGHDLIAALERDIRSDGSIAQQVNWTSFAVLALRAAGVAPAPRMLGWIVAQQNRDGGFSFGSAGDPSDPDDTGAALEALAGDSTATAVRARGRAVAYLRAVQDRDGGFASQPGEGSNAQSTAWAVQGLVAAGVAPASVRRDGGPSPLAYLVSLAAPDGSIRYARGQAQTPVWVTGEALMALEDRPLPLAAPHVTARVSGSLDTAYLAGAIGLAEALALALAGLG